jgi:hypothetical protein
MFLGFKEGENFVEMKKPSKKKSFAFSWEGPFYVCKVLGWSLFFGTR